MKKHFIFLGAAGVIYYSWLLALIFVAFIVGYESNKSISYPAIALETIFAIIPGLILIFKKKHVFIG